MSIVDNLFKKPVKPKGDKIQHFPSFVPGYFHQADLLFLPNDDGYKYALVVVDTGSHLVDARPLKSKSNDSILKAFKSIYSGKILSPPSTLISVDSGSEFKGYVEKYLKNDLGLNIKVAQPGRHKQQAFVERKNRDIAKILFKTMTEEELLTGEVSTAWIDYLPEAIKIINDHTKKHPIKKRKLSEKYIKQDLLVQGTKVRVALNEPRDTFGNKLHGQFRETDIRFGITPKTIMSTLISPGVPGMYLLDDGKGGTDYSVAYARYELQPIDSRSEKLPHEKTIKGIKENKVQKWHVDHIIDKKKEKGKVYYLVKWKGFKTPTWEPLSQLKKDIKNVIKEFEYSLKIK